MRLAFVFAIVDTRLSADAQGTAAQVSILNVAQIETANLCKLIRSFVLISGNPYKNGV
jgi:hypothetical protein